MSVRPAAVAGQFYPGAAAELAEILASFVVAPMSARRPKAIIVPHAGYRYSGALAGRAYSLALEWVERVVVAGPNHTVPLTGAALPAHERWWTPLGEVRIDTTEVLRLAGRPDTVIDDAPHAREHCLEVQVPFLQQALPAPFSLVPLLVGEMSLSATASLLRDAWGAENTLLVLSTDLSHYSAYEVAQRTDQATADAIVHAKPDALQAGSACGWYPLRGLLQIAAEDDLEIQQLGLCNSGDTQGARDRVVGYGAYAVYASTA